MCIVHKKHVKHVHVESEKSLSVLERQSQNIFSLFPKEVTQSSNRPVKNKVTSIFGPIEDRLYKETKQQKTRSYSICVIIRLFRRKHGAQRERAHFLAKTSG